MMFAAQCIRKRGFTLTEIMVVVSVIGLLAALALPSMARARASTRKSICINNLKQIDSAKQIWAIENKAGSDSKPKAPDIIPFLKNNRMPECPAGGKYKIQRIRLNPTCNLKQQLDHNLDSADIFAPEDEW